MHFLSGIPRSGSTVLAAILNQNPEVHVSTTSGLIHALDGLANTWHSQQLLANNDPSMTVLAQTMRGAIDAFYEKNNASVIIDKSRGWPIPSILNSMHQVLGRKPKIIATVRSVADCMASFVRIAKPENLDDFIYSGVYSDHLKAAYISLQQGYQKFPECFLFVEYEDLLRDPSVQLERIHKFLELPSYNYDLNNIDGSSVEEDDEKLHGVNGMHDIKPVLARQHNENSKDVLKHHYWTFAQPEFWLDTPRTTPEIQDLDLQLFAAKTGNFTEAWQLCQKIEREDPTNHRAAYNRGWFKLREGKILEGYQLLDRGRIAKVFGDSPPNTSTQKWDGISKGTVLLQLEGGLGDHIHQIRYAKIIAERGCKVVVSTTPQLAPIFSEVDGVSAIVQQGVEAGVYHNYWVAGMSAVVPLQLELKDIKGTPYINIPAKKANKKFTVGLRWQGNPMFEHDHNKYFSPHLMMDAVKGFDFNFISLQRDEGSQFCPSWVENVSLNTWEDTRNAISQCDLVISSCTSVSHMSAAMGINTWVITPIMPYFLYAMDGESTPYYDSMKLIRQTEFENWHQPFDIVRKQLSEIQTQLLTRSK